MSCEWLEGTAAALQTETTWGKTAPHAFPLHHKNKSNLYIEECMLHFIQNTSGSVDLESFLSLVSVGSVRPVLFRYYLFVSPRPIMFYELVKGLIVINYLMRFPDTVSVKEIRCFINNQY